MSDKTTIAAAAKAHHLFLIRVGPPALIAADCNRGGDCAEPKLNIKAILVGLHWAIDKQDLNLPGTQVEKSFAPQINWVYKPPVLTYKMDWSVPPWN